MRESSDSAAGPVHLNAKGVAMNDICEIEVADAAFPERGTAATRAVGPKVGFDWSAVDAIVERIPAGRWASYGSVARAAGLPVGYAQALGRHLADDGPEGAWRVLTADRGPSPRFRIDETQVSGDLAEVIAWLKDEGIRFDHLNRARPHSGLDVSQLRRLHATNPRR